MNCPDHDELLRLLYAGTMEADPWKSFLSALRGALDAMAATIILTPPHHGRPTLMANVGGRTKWEIDYQDHFFSINPFVGLPLDLVVTRSEFVSDDAYLASEFYTLFMKPTGSLHVMGVDTRSCSGITAEIRITRADGTADFGAREKQILQDLLPHMRQALDIFARVNRVESERSFYARTVNLMALAVIILGPGGEVTDCNAVAETLLGEEDGLLLEDGKLKLTDPGAAARLENAVARILAHQPGDDPDLASAIRVERPSGRADLGLLVKPTPAPHGMDDQALPGIAILISDPERDSTTSSRILGDLFGLTPAESELSVLLANGMTLDEASAEKGISRNTARAHLRAIFSKTGVTRQTMLVRLVLKSVAELGHDH